MTTTTTSRFIRFTPDNECPACHGWQRMPQHQGIRCAGGYFAGDDKAFFCSRDEYAGSLPLIERMSPPSYRHMRARRCGCGAEHAWGGYSAPPARPPIRIAPRPHAQARRKSVTSDYDTTDGKPKRLRLRTPYPYYDANNRLLAYHVRYDFENAPKSFKWQQPGADGSCTGPEHLGRPLAELPLYNLPLLLAAEPGPPIFYTEGEKDCNSLIDRGFLAVCTGGGAGFKPTNTILTPLRPHQVYVWADNDEDGRKHKEWITHQLLEMGNAPQLIVWPDAPVGGGAADFLGDVNQLIEAAQPPGGFEQILPPEPNRQATKQTHLRFIEEAPTSRWQLKISPSGLAAKLHDCRRHQIAMNDENYHWWAIRISCNEQICAYSGPTRLWLDWQAKLAKQIDGWLWRLSELRPDKPISSDTPLKTTRNLFTALNKRKATHTRGTYGCLFEAAMQPKIILAEPINEPIRPTPGFQRTIFFTGATSDQLYTWFERSYQIESADAATTPAEFVDLLNQTKGRMRFRTFGLQAVEAQAGDDADGDLLRVEGKQVSISAAGGSGGAAKTLEHRERSCPECGLPLQLADLSVGPEMFMDPSDDDSPYDLVRIYPERVGLNPRDRRLKPEKRKW